MKNKKRYFKIAFSVCMFLLMSCSVIISAAAAPDNQCPVTFTVNVNSELNELYNYIYVTVQNKETFDVYSFNIYRKDDWKVTENLPSGKYSIVAGGVLNDWKNEYPVEYKDFEVAESGNTKVTFKCGSGKVNSTAEANTAYTDASDVPYTNDQSHSVIAQTTQLISSDSSEESPSHKSFGYIPFIIVIAAIAWYIYKKKKNSTT